MTAEKVPQHVTVHLLVLKVLLVFKASLIPTPRALPYVLIQLHPPDLHLLLFLILCAFLNYFYFLLLTTSAPHLIYRVLQNDCQKV